MHTLETLTLLAALAGQCLSASTGQKGFSVSQVATGKAKHASGPAALQAAYHRYNQPVPEALATAAAAAAAAGDPSGSVAADPEMSDSQYLSPVKIGAQGATLMLDFDTGSADLWAFSTSQPVRQRLGHSIYRPGASAKRLPGETWRIKYADESGASGIVFADKVVIGGVTATSQAVEAATSVSTSFSQNTNADGLVGLAFSSINTVKPKQALTFFDNVKSSLPSPLFAAYLRKGQPGSYDFGFIDNSKFNGQLTYVPVNSSRGLWEFKSTGFSVGGGAAAVTTADIDAIADTGTSILLMSSDIVAAYWQRVRGARNSQLFGGYVFPCSAQLPDFGLRIGNSIHTVPGSYLKYTMLPLGSCYGGLQASPVRGLNVLGDVFLKSQYVVFDAGNSRIGFAPQK